MSPNQPSFFFGLATPAIEADVVKPNGLVISEVDFDLDVALRDRMVAAVAALAASLPRPSRLVSVVSELPGD